MARITRRLPRTALGRVVMGRSLGCFLQLVKPGSAVSLAVAVCFRSADFSLMPLVNSRSEPSKERTSSRAERALSPHPGPLPRGEGERGHIFLETGIAGFVNVHC